MIGHTLNIARFVGAHEVPLWGSFQTSGAGTPDPTTFRTSRGLSFTVAYAATGVYTVTLGTGWNFPNQAYTVQLTVQSATLATDWFEVVVIGETTVNTATPQFVVQCHRNGTAQAPAATAGNRVNFILVASNSTGA